MSPIAKARVSGSWVEVDQAGAVRVGGAWVEFGPEDPGAGESLFTAQTPVVTDATDGIPLHLGTYIEFAVAGSITHVRWFAPATLPSGPVKFAIFSGASLTKLTQPEDLAFSSLTAGQWNQVALGAPVAVTAGATMITAVRTPDRYVASVGGSSPFPLTTGNLNASESDGRFTASDPNGFVQLPDTASNNGCYFVDVVFVPD